MSKIDRSKRDLTKFKITTIKDTKGNDFEVCTRIDPQTDVGDLRKILREWGQSEMKVNVAIINNEENHVTRRDFKFYGTISPDSINMKLTIVLYEEDEIKDDE